MNTDKALNASRFISRLNLNVASGSYIPYTYWCRVAYNRYDRLNLKEQRHSFFELHLCINGESEYTVDGADATIHRGEFILIPPQTPHTVIGASEDFEKLVWGFMPTDPSEAEQLAEACTPISVQNDIPKQWYNSIDRLLEEGSHVGDCSVDIIRGELGYLYKNLCRRFLHYCTANIAAVRKVGVRAAAIRDFISDNLAARLSVSDISAQFYLSERQIERLCIAEYNMTVGDLIRDLRAAAIRKLLSDTNFSLSEIAHKTGFSDRYSMSKFFKKAEGMPPAKYRSSLIE